MNHWDTIGLLYIAAGIGYWAWIFQTATPKEWADLRVAYADVKNHSLPAAIKAVIFVICTPLGLAWLLGCWPLHMVVELRWRAKSR